MTITIKAPDIHELKPRITVIGVGGAGGNAVNNMIRCGLAGVDFVVANTDAQALLLSTAERRIQMGIQVTEGLGAGSLPEVGRSAAEEVMDEIRDQLSHVHMVFITAGMGGGTGTGAAPVIARVAREMGILTVGVVTKPFHFEGQRRMRVAEAGIAELQKAVDTLIVIPNQNLFRIANEKTTFAEAFAMADQVLLSGVASVTDLIVKPGLINLDFADVRAVMRDMGKAMMGTGEATGDSRAILAAEAAIANPLLDETSMKGARGLLISITGGKDMKIYEVDEAANRIREEVDVDANVIFGATQDESLDGIIRVSVVATGLDAARLEAARLEEAGGAGAATGFAGSAIDRNLARITDQLRAQMAARAAAMPVSVSVPVSAPVSAPVAMAPAEDMSQGVAAQEPAPGYASYGFAPLPAAPAMTPQAVSEQVAPARAEPAAPIVATADMVVAHAAPPRATFFAAPIVEEQAVERYTPPVTQAPFIPPVAEQAGIVRAQSMPRIEDLPAPGQALYNASRESAVNAPPAPMPHKQQMTLMQRLASFGLGGRSEEDGQAEGVGQPGRAFVPQQAPMPQAAPPRQAPAPNYRAAQGALDAQGRALPTFNGGEDDFIEIPTFMRRQAK